MVGGIDTHADLHQAAVIDGIGRHLATEKFETTPDGYRRLLNRLQSHGVVLAVGIEGTGAYGAEIARFLASNAVTVVEVDRPDRKARRDGRVDVQQAIPHGLFHDPDQHSGRLSLTVERPHSSAIHPYTVRSTSPFTPVDGELG